MKDQRGFPDHQGVCDQKGSPEITNGAERREEKQDRANDFGKGFSKMLHSHLLKSNVRVQGAESYEATLAPVVGFPRFLIVHNNTAVATKIGKNVDEIELMIHHHPISSRIASFIPASTKAS
jgi:hypothetical protein